MVSLRLALQFCSLLFSRVRHNLIEEPLSLHIYVCRVQLHDFARRFAWGACRLKVSCWVEGRRCIWKPFADASCSCPCLWNGLLEPHNEVRDNNGTFESLALPTLPAFSQNQSSLRPVNDQTPLVSHQRSAFFQTLALFQRSSDIARPEVIPHYFMRTKDGAPSRPQSALTRVL